MTMTRRTYVRPMDGWWKRDPFFLAYMAREVTSIFVVIYALILLNGMLHLAEGEAAFDGWVANLRSPAAIALHALLLAVFVYHTVSWFRVMPKTMAPVVVGGKKLPAQAITGAGLVASLVASIALLVAFRAIAP